MQLGDRRFFQRVQVRVGDEDPAGDINNVVSKNEVCDNFWQYGEELKYYDFNCPSPGIKGKYITVSSSKTGGLTANDRLSGAEVEIFGTLCILDILIRFIDLILS